MLGFQYGEKPKLFDAIQTRGGDIVIKKFNKGFESILCALVRPFQSQIIKVMLIDLLFSSLFGYTEYVVRTKRNSSNIQISAETPVKDIFQTAEWRKTDS